jgi:hypothetical protein
MRAKFEDTEMHYALAHSPLYPNHLRQQCIPLRQDKLDIMMLHFALCFTNFVGEFCPRANCYYNAHYN